MAVSYNSRDVTIMSGWVTSVRFSIRMQRIFREAFQCGNWVTVAGAIAALNLLICDEIQKDNIIKMWSYNIYIESERLEVTSWTTYVPSNRRTVVRCLLKDKARNSNRFTFLCAKVNSYLCIL